MQKKTIVRWAIHKLGTEQLGYLWPTKADAEKKLEELKKDISHLPLEEQDKHVVVEVQVSWEENN